MRAFVGTLVGKSVAGAARLRSGNSGQALPGLVVEKLIPGYLRTMLRQLPEGVVIITGTNGKTTTTKMVVELLRASGKRVLTNPTGSNMTRGVISTLSHQAKASGKLPFDIAVLEMDEAYGRELARLVPTRWVLALNVSRDQLDRFGEVDYVAQLITETMQLATEGCVVNADDGRLGPAGEALAKTHVVRFFGVAPALHAAFPSDNELVSVEGGQPLATSVKRRDVELLQFSETTATYDVSGKHYEASMQVTGQHNFQNAAAALALVMALEPDVPVETWIERLASVRIAFGRGQIYQLPGGAKVQLALVKNPASFRQGLASYLRKDTRLVIAINDNIADGRDMSWLWDVDFTILHKNTPVEGSSFLFDDGVYMAAGVRAADMALRLQYDNVTVARIEPSLEKLAHELAAKPGETLIMASYTAMMRLHHLLTRAGEKAP